jgi:hypothetical protein
MLVVMALPYSYGFNRLVSWSYHRVAAGAYLLRLLFWGAAFIVVVEAT